MAAEADGLDAGRALDVAVSAARAAGGLLLERMSSIREIRHKGVVDIVTDADLASEQLVMNTLRAAFPTHMLVGEEGGAQAGGDPRFRWFVDPLDGTTNYAHGFPYFCVSIGLEANGELLVGAVYAPYLDELFVARRGHGATLNGQPIRVSAIGDLQQALLATGFPYEHAQFGRALRSFEVLSLESQAVRRFGSAALDLCYVACGRLDGYWEHQLKPWDLAAGALAVGEAGGAISTTDGGSFSVECEQVLVSNGALHAVLTERLRGL